jgi:acetyl-CoA carboxylase carboxyltransferase component
VTSVALSEEVSAEQLGGWEVHARTTGQIDIVVDTDEPDRRLDLLHDNVRKYGTVFNTVAPGTELSGTLRRLCTFSGQSH